MPFLIKDGVLESATGSGTGNLTVTGAVAEYQSLVTAGYANGDTFPAYIKGAAGTGEWQTAILTYNTGGTVSRTTPIDGSSGVGVAVNFTAGAKQIGVVLSAALAGWQQIGSVNTTSGSSVSFTSIPATYSDLYVEMVGVSHDDTGTSRTIRVEFTGDNGGAWTAPIGLASNFANTSGLYGAILIPNYKGAAGAMPYSSSSSLTTDVTSTASAGTIAWRIAAGINGIRFSPSAGSFDAGTIKLFARL